MNIEIGKYYKTRCGHKVRIYSTEGNNPDHIIHGATLWQGGWRAEEWDKDGFYYGREKLCELDIIAEWVEPHPAESWEVDKKILVSDDQINWYKKYFAKFENGYFYAWYDGRSSWNEKKAASWKYAKPAEEE